MRWNERKKASIILRKVANHNSDHCTWRPWVWKPRLSKSKAVDTVMICSKARTTSPWPDYRVTTEAVDSSIILPFRPEKFGHKHQESCSECWWRRQGPEELRPKREAYLQFGLVMPGSADGSTHLVANVRHYLTMVLNSQQSPTQLLRDRPLTPAKSFSTIASIWRPFKLAASAASVMTFLIQSRGRML